MRERLKAKPSEVVCKYLFAPAILEDSKRSFKNMIKVNLAHVLMIKKQGIISVNDAKKLTSSLLTLQNKGHTAFELDPQLEDYYFNIEQYIISQVGLDVGGKIHTGRSRNDLHSTISRMNVRDSIIPMYSRMLELRSTLLKLASDHKETVLTGYTHMQPAQPITLAHYFAAIAEAVGRDYERLENAYKRLNYCTLGSGAFAGTSFNIDRHYTSLLLGFSGPIENSLDAVASRDYLLEISSGYATFGSTINRFANDLYIWTTDEFGFIEVDDSMAVCSSIMPQKKNPITLEHIKSKTSHLLSAYVSIFTCMKGIPYGHCRDLAAESIRLFWDASAQMEAILELLNATLKTMRIRQETMKSRANCNYSTVTELADELVRREGVSFRVAHQIVGEVVGNCIDSGLPATDITIDMVQAAVKDYTDQKFLWTQEHLNYVLEATNSVCNKLSLGSPAPEECQRMIDNSENRLVKDKETYRDLVNKLQQSYDKLYKEVNQINID
ncbi:argininosuccinate lyase [Petroclostridium sp. X23]|uniref:argininosuccinate lyase n=1 Tax=Petroclostridium sp. X23 TaxID=3045146 RepID=UPI0024AD8643|nr:argininosuccinate lyase [Petroclostridium sp. X23]WHH58211.1 argininosuccinate lyase [Petroclostridium sp. X23]